MTVTAHFVTFFSPGSFVSEETTEPVNSWDPAAALTRARQITERHNAKPYGFRFTTRTRTDADLDSKVSATSPMYYFGCKVETLAEVQARAPGSILAENMRINDIARIATTTSGYRHSAPLKDEDIVLDDAGRPLPR
jgi:hypothetical protein